MVFGHQSQKEILDRVWSNYQQGGFLLSGPAGVGKFSLVKEMAAAKTTKDNLVVIESGQKFLTKETADFIRQLTQLTSASRRVIIVNDAHAFTKEAQSSLLKIIEAIPSNTFLFFVTDRPQKILVTIRSRLIPIRFSLVDAAEMKNWLLTVSMTETEAKKLLQFFPGQPGLIARVINEKDKLKLVSQFFQEKLPLKKMLLAEQISQDLELAECVQYLLIFERLNLIKNWGDQTIIKKLKNLLQLYFDSDFYLNKALQIKNLCLNYYG